MDFLTQTPQLVPDAATTSWGKLVVTLILGLYSVVQTVRSENVQKVIAPQYRWDALKPWVRMLVVFLMAALTSVGAVLVGQATIAQAVVSGIVMFVGAMGVHSAVKTLPEYKAKEALSVRLSPPPLKPTTAGDIIKAKAQREQRTADRTLGSDDIGPVEM